MASAKRGGAVATQVGFPILATAAALAALDAAWAGFQWRQLAVARRGGDPFCALGSAEACAELADSAFARGVEALSGIPVAGWGVAWGLVALALPLLGLSRLRAGRALEPFWSGVALCAVAGLAGVALLLGVSLREGVFCGNCVLSYAGVVAYAAVVLSAAYSAPPRRLGSGAAWAGVGVAAAAVLLLPVAAITPPARERALATLLAPEPAPQRSADDPSAALLRRVAALGPDERQLLSNARALYLDPPQEVELRRPRALHGSPMAPVRITVFSDPLCSHCADLHDDLEQLLDAAPPHTIAVESRKFPLHGGCNPYLANTGEPPLRCLATQVLICLEDHPQAFEIEGSVLAVQRELSVDRLFAETAPFAPRAVLEQCAASRETQAKLGADIEWAMAHAIEGTPLVLVNGRKTPPYLPFLYAMAVSGGDPDHPAFRDLPPPSLAPARPSSTASH